MPQKHRAGKVALPVPLFQTFTYAVDSAAASASARNRGRGCRSVPKWIREGICLGPAGSVRAARKVRTIIDVSRRRAGIERGHDRALSWMQTTMVVPIGIAMRTALPSLLSVASSRAITEDSQHRPPARDLPTLLEREDAFARAPKQRALFEALESLADAARSSISFSICRSRHRFLKAIEKGGFVVIEAEEVDRDPFAARPISNVAKHQPTVAQTMAIAAIAEANPGEVFLLNGVTGSGKTLVYIEVLKRLVLEQGKTGIVLVPEIALTPQTVDRFRAVFGDSIAVLHSALSDGERYDAWLALRRGERRIAVGARSAVFAPLANLGAIIVDEEHETSYKQGENPRYHAREVAIVRARLEGATVVLGSATPSLESWANAEAGNYALLNLPERVWRGRLPQIGRCRPAPADGPDAPREGAGRLAYAYVIRYGSTARSITRLREKSRPSSSLIVADTRRSSFAVNAHTSCVSQLQLTPLSPAPDLCYVITADTGGLILFVAAAVVAPSGIGALEHSSRRLSRTVSRALQSREWTSYTSGQMGTRRDS